MVQATSRQRTSNRLHLRDGAGSILWYVPHVVTGRSATNATLQLPKERNSHFQRLLDVFLPAGYPSSVTDDYIQYVPRLLKQVLGQTYLHMSSIVTLTDLDSCDQQVPNLRTQILTPLCDWPIDKHLLH